MSPQPAIARIGPRPIGDRAGVAAQQRPVGPLIYVFQKWCCEESPLTSNARHVLVQIAKRMRADDEGRQVAFMGEKTLVHDTALSQRTVRRAVQKLRVAGAIKTFPGGVTRGHHHHCNGFELLMD